MKKIPFWFNTNSTILEWTLVLSDAILRQSLGSLWLFADSWTQCLLLSQTWLILWKKFNKTDFFQINLIIKTTYTLQISTLTSSAQIYYKEFFGLKCDLNILNVQLESIFIAWLLVRMLKSIWKWAGDFCKHRSVCWENQFRCLTFLARIKVNELLALQFQQGNWFWTWEIFMQNYLLCSVGKDFDVNENPDLPILLKEA